MTSNYDYFDFFHALLPTALPIRDFYKELTSLYKGSRSMKNKINLMRKYPLRELPSLFRAYGNFLKWLDNLDQDYVDSDHGPKENMMDSIQMQRNW